MAMLRRALLALLALCLAVPAVAAPLMHGAPCAQVQMTMPMAGHGQGHHHAMPNADMAPLHDCIGCATPVAPPADVGAAGMLAQAAPEVRPAVLMMRATTGPDSPPPRA